MAINLKKLLTLSTLVALVALVVLWSSLVWSQGNILGTEPPDGSVIEEGKIMFILDSLGGEFPDESVLNQTTGEMVNSVVANRCIDVKSSGGCKLELMFTTTPGHSYVVKMGAATIKVRARGDLPKPPKLGKERLMPPLTLMDKAARKIRAGSVSDCIPLDQYPKQNKVSTFTNALGRTEIAHPCDGNIDRLYWLTIYPKDTPNIRYRIFFIEAGFSVQLKEKGGWVDGCTESACNTLKLPPEEIEVWKKGWKAIGGFNNLSTRVWALVQAHYPAAKIPAPKKK